MVIRRIPLWSALGLSLALQVADASACTTVALPDSQGITVAKSYDWQAGHGVVFHNKRGVSKRALDATGVYSEPASWVSEHSSVTFTQFALDMPLGGMNDAGLVVEIMWLDGSRYPVDSALPDLNELQWIQYLLDTAADAGEAELQARKVEVKKIFADVHYLVCDIHATCKSFEYLGGELVVQDATDAPALTNDPYGQSRQWLSDYIGFGGTRSLPAGAGSFARYARSAYRSVAMARNGNWEQEGFAALDDVRWSYSQWQIVYRPTIQEVRFRHARRNQEHGFSAEAFDRSCESPVMVMDLTGDVSGRSDGIFVEADENLYQDLATVGNRSIGSPFGEEVIRKLVKYQTTHTRCTE